MKNKRIQRVISIILNIAIILSVFSVSVVAEENSSSGTGQSENSQLTQGVYEFNNTITEYNSTDVIVPYFNKYQTNNAGFWNYDNIQISKENGFMSYSTSLFSLQATNGLNIDLGLHYDSDSADISNNAAESDLITATNSSRESFCNFYDTRYGLGAGWSFNVPTIEFVGTNKYLHTSDGNKYKINSLNKLEGYYTNDIIVNNATSGEFTVNSVPAVYRIIDVNNSKMYFDADGRYLGIADKCGNKIKVEYNNDDLISKIIEPAGRYVKFNYQNTASTKTVTVTLFDNTAQETDSQRIFTIKEQYDETNDCYKLTSIFDAINREISFDYSVSNNNIEINGIDNPFTSKALLLKGIENYNGAYVGIEYENKVTSYGSAGAKSYQAVSKCYKKNSKTQIAEKERVTYTYEYENTVNWRFSNTSNHTLNDSATMKVTSSVDEYATEGITELRNESTINSSSRNIKDREYSYVSTDETPVKNISTVEYSGFNAYNLPAVTMNKTLGDNSKFLFTRNINTYDQFGNITESTTFSGTGDGDTLTPYKTVDSKSSNSYNYSLSKTIPIISAEYTKSDANKIYAKVTFNTISSSSGKITKSVVKTFDMTNVENLSSLETATPIEELIETNFTYSSNGNLTKETVKDLQYDGETNTSYTYDSKYSAYVARTIQSGIKNADGTANVNINGSSNTITKSNYDMFGNEIASFDAYGNQTLNFYDEAGNLTSTGKYDTPYKTVFNWENETTGNQYPNINGFNSDTSAWSGKYSVIDNQSHLCSGSTKGIKIQNKVSYNADCRVALNVTENMMKNSLGMRFYAAPYKANAGIKVSFKDYDSVNYDVYSTSDTKGGWIDISWNGSMYKNGKDVWEWTNGTVSDLQKTKTIWITFQNMTAGSVAYLDDIQLLLNESGQDIVTVSSTQTDYENNIVITSNKDGTGNKTISDALDNTTKTYEKLPSGNYKLTSESEYNSNNQNTVEKSYVTPELYTVTISVYNERGEVVSSIVKDQDNKQLNKTDSSHSVQVVDGKLYNVSHEHYYTGTTTDNKTRDTYTYTNASGQTIKTKTVNGFVDGSVSHEATTYEENVYGNFGEQISSDSDENGKEEYYKNSTGETVITAYDGNSDDDNKIYESSVNDNFGQTICETDANINANVENLGVDNLSSSNGVLTKYDAAGRDIETKTPFKYTSNIDNDEEFDFLIEKKYYDANGNVIQEKTLKEIDADGNEVYTEKVNSYDAENNLIMVEQKNDDESQYTQYVYDDNNRVIRIYSGLSKALTINSADSVIANGDNNYSVIKYTYDFYGNKTSYTDQKGKTEYYEYNEYSGFLDKVTKRDGTVVTYTYDVQGNVLSKTAVKTNNDTVKKSYTYDYDNNKQTSAISKKADGESEFTVEYKTVYNNNENGSVYNEKTINYLTDRTINKAYEYDIKGNVTKLSVSSVADETLLPIYQYDYTYYDSGKLKDEKYTVSNSTVKPVTSYTYDCNGNIISKITKNSLNEDSHQIKAYYRYNLANNCTEESHYSIMNSVLDAYGSAYSQRHTYRYEYSPDGNMKQKKLEYYVLKKSAPSYTIGLTKYTYDKLNRLTAEQYIAYNEVDSQGSYTDIFSYDDYNNISVKNHDEVGTTKDTVTTSSYDKTRLASQIESNVDNEELSQITYSYDDNGNMTTKTAVKGEDTTLTEFDYDTFDRTKSIKIGNTTTSFNYNAGDDRVMKTTGSKVTETILDNGSISADLVTDDNTNTTKVFSENNEVYCDIGTFTYNEIAVNGDIITATNGEVYNNYQFDAYGKKISQTANDRDLQTVTATATTNPIGYRNYYYDNETGLYYLKARYYDPNTAQFTQEDTVQDDNLQYNLYGYCSGNPISYTDPSGHRQQVHWGSSGKDVKHLQKRLNSMNIRDYGGKKLKEDGHFGDKTHTAVLKFQSINGLKVDGYVGTNTWFLLDKDRRTFNCYGYAMNDFYHYLQPHGSYESVEKFRNTIISQFGNNKARKIQNKNSAINKNEYRIAIRVQSHVDFHLMKQDSQGYGFWSEKHGRNEINYYNYQINPDNWGLNYGNNITGIDYNSKTLYLAIKFKRK